MSEETVSLIGSRAEALRRGKTADFRSVIDLCVSAPLRETSVWDENAQAERADEEFDAGAGEVGFAVDVEQAGRGTLDHDPRARAKDDARRLGQRAAKEPPEQRSGIPKTERRHGGEVEEAVVHAGAGSDESLVAVLITVGHGEGEGLDGFLAAIAVETVALRPMGTEQRGAGSEVASKAATSGLVEFGGELGFEAEACGGDERMAVGEAGIPAVGLWARVPHYVAAMPYPAASAALVDGLTRIAELEIDTAALQTAAAASNQQIAQLIAGSEEHAALVRQLELQHDSELPTEPTEFGDLPSGDELAAELERFLRGER